MQITKIICNLSTIRFWKKSENTCWHCKAISAELFCQNCNCLQKPNINENFFKIIGINEEFEINENMVSKKFKDLQRLLHPDKFSNKTTTEQSISEDYSSLVNKAYSTLINPLTRGIYILQLKGYELPEKTDLESKFLHEIMELNEEVESAETPDEIFKIEEKNKIAIQTLKNELNNVLKKQDYTQAINILVKMKYFISVEDQIKNVIRNMKVIR